MEVAVYSFINISTAMKCHSVLFDSTGSGVGGLRYQFYAWDHFGIKGQLLSLCPLVSIGNMGQNIMGNYKT